MEARACRSSALISMFKAGDKVDYCCPKTGLWSFLGTVSRIGTDEDFFLANAYKVTIETPRNRLDALLIKDTANPMLILQKRILYISNANFLV